MGYLIALGVCAVPLLIALASIWQGYVLTVLWGWFAVPTFGLPQLGVAQAIGICLVVGMFRGTTDCDDNRETVEKIVTPFVRAALGPLLMLGVGWIVKGFM